MMFRALKRPREKRGKYNIVIDSGQNMTSPDVVARLLWETEQRLRTRGVRRGGGRPRKGAMFDAIRLLPHQKKPDGDWFIWFIRGGRGSGKTFPANYYAVEHLRTLGDKAIVHVVAPTQNSLRRVNFEGASGLMTRFGDEFKKYNKSEMTLEHRFGGRVLGFSDEARDRLDGPECTLLIADEVGLWSEKTWNTAIMGVRAGDDPRVIISSTPKNRRFLYKIEEQNNCVGTHATLRDNPYTARTFKDAILEKFDGTLIGKQEIDGNWMMNDPRALFRLSWIADNRRLECDPQRVVVGVDPAVTANPKTSDQTGITVACVSHDGDYDVLHSEGIFATPEEWGRRTVELYHHYEANLIVAEVNQGGDLVTENIRHIDPNVPIKSVRATKGKALRAEPIANLYQQGRVHHHGIFSELEDQMCLFGIDSVDDILKDQLDSLVWAITELTARSVIFSSWV